MLLLATGTLEAVGEGKDSSFARLEQLKAHVILKVYMQGRFQYVKQLAEHL